MSNTDKYPFAHCKNHDQYYVLVRLQRAEAFGRYFEMHTLKQQAEGLGIEVDIDPKEKSITRIEIIDPKKQEEDVVEEED